MKIMKGISPVIATILMVMITVGIVAFSYTWFVSMGESGKKTTMTYISQMEKAQQKIEIGTAYQCGNDICFELRASGMNTVKIPANEIKVYINDKPVKWDGWNANGVGISCTGGVDPSSLVGSWHFSEGSGNIAHDDSGNGNDGTLYGGLDTSGWVDGKYGKALKFDGSNDYIRADISGTPILKSFTLSCWGKPLSINDKTGNLISMYLGGAGTAIGVNNGLATALIGEGGTLKLTLTSTSTYLDKFHHFVLVVDDNTLTARLYVDGTEEDSDNYGSSMTQPLSYIKNGVGTGLGLGYFEGIIDEVQIYNRALTQEEIQQLYNLRLSPGKSCYGKIPNYNCNLGDNLRIEHPWGATATVSINGC